MKPNSKPHQVKTQGVAATGSFGISTKDTAHIMTILRDTLYSDKILALLREYSSNAWDAHIEAGLGNRPIKVTLPTTMSPELKIRDFGSGLSQDDVFQVYTQYGASTKRDSNTAVGMLGIGSKSGFAYSDSFTVVSYHGGKKSTYVAVIDESERGVINLLHEEDCGTETGVQIQIPVKTTDIRNFHSRALHLFKHFDPLPDINVDLPEPPEATKLQHGWLSTKDDEWIAVMGCIPYRLNLDQLRGMEEGIGEFIYNISGAVKFSIGEVEISASREELKYSDKTKKALVEKINLLVDEFVRFTLDSIKDETVSFWYKRLRAQVLNKLGLPIPKEYKDITQDHVTLPLDDKKFTLINGQANSVQRIPVSVDTRVFLGDDDKNIKGFNLGHYDIIVKPVGDEPLDKVRTSLEALLRAKGMTGLPIKKLSEVPWRPLPKPGQKYRAKNKKHTVRTFVLNAMASFCKPFSKCWDIIKREPTDNDVFVILSCFETSGFNIYIQYEEDRMLASYVKKKMPPIYGYKTTTKRPVTADKCRGLEYREWRQKFHEELAQDPEVQKLLALMQWATSPGCHLSSWQWRWRRWRQKSWKNMFEYLRMLIRNLGKTHPITQYFIKQAVARKRLRRTDDIRFNTIEKLNRLLGLDYDNEATRAYDKLIEMYPIFSVQDREFQGLWHEEHYELWCSYVHLVDRHERTSNAQPTTTSIHDHQRVCNCCLGREDVRGEEGLPQLSSPPKGSNGRGLGLSPEESHSGLQPQ